MGGGWSPAVRPLCTLCQEGGWGDGVGATAAGRRELGDGTVPVLSPAPTPSPSLSLGPIALWVPQPHPAPSFPPSPAPGPSTAPPLTRAAPSLPPSCPPPLPSLCLNPFPWACPWQRTPFCSFCWIHKRKEGTKKNKREAKQPYSQLPPSAARVSDEEGGFYAIGANCLNKTSPSLPIGPSCA